MGCGQSQPVSGPRGPGGRQGRQGPPPSMRQTGSMPGSLRGRRDPQGQGRRPRTQQPQARPPMGRVCAGDSHYSAGKPYNLVQVFSHQVYCDVCLKRILDGLELPKCQNFEPGEEPHPIKAGFRFIGSVVDPDVTNYDCVGVNYFNLADSGKCWQALQSSPVLKAWRGQGGSAFNSQIPIRSRDAVGGGRAKPRSGPGGAYSALQTTQYSRPATSGNSASSVGGRGRGMGSGPGRQGPPSDTRLAHQGGPAYTATTIGRPQRAARGRPRPGQHFPTQGRSEPSAYRAGARYA